jgi:ribosomal subunit interface protein
MDILIHADGLTLTDGLRDAVEEKIGRVEQYAPRAVRARVHLRQVSAHPSARQYVARVLFELPGADQSAEEYAADPLAAVEIVSEKIERRLRRQKTRRLANRKHASPRQREKA